MPSDMQNDYRRSRITALEYRRMGELGIIAGQEHIELLDGELIAMAPIGPDHAYSVRQLTTIFVRRFADRAIVDVQNPLALDAYSEPEPDLMLLSARSDRYRRALPEPKDVLLVVEVSNSSWQYDRHRKLHAYARSGIDELWIVRIAADCVLQFRKPINETYLEERTFERGSSIATAAFPDAAIDIDSLLP